MGIWTIVGVLGGIFIFSVLLWRKAPQDKALVVTGLKRRVITGSGGFVVPFFEITDRISLENIKVEVKTQDSLDSNGVPIDTDGVAIVKVSSDKTSILMAVEQFNTGDEKETIQVIKSTVQDVLEGKLREIISKLSVEEIYSDRQRFADQVEEVAKTELDKMGLELKTFTIRDIDDKNGYLQALGAKQIAEVKKNAAIAQAEANREQMEKTSDAIKKGTEAQLIAEAEIARAQKEKELKVQAFREEQEKAKANADFAYQVQQNIVKKEVIETEKNAQLLEEQRLTEIAQQQALKKERELEATVKKVAEADKYSQNQRAEALRYEKLQEAEAEAEAIRMKGQATADAMKAEAEAMKLKAEAYKQYGEAAIVEMLVAKLPEVAKYISEPLSKTEKMVIIDNNGSGGANRLSQNVTNMVAEIPEVFKALTGVDLVTILDKINKDNPK